ncbi:MAG: hypothetical protein ACKO1J_08410 [Tagaea sp.]
MPRIDAFHRFADAPQEVREAPLLLAPAHEVTPRLAELATLLRAELAFAELISPA